MSKELGLGVSPREQALHVAVLETEVPCGGPDRIWRLARVAKAACEASDYKKAESDARELLSTAGNDPKDPSYGEAIFYGNLLLGRVAWARDHDLEKAKAALLASRQTPGSSALMSFGPNMTLAKELLEAGERDTVAPILRGVPVVLEDGFEKTGRMECQNQRLLPPPGLRPQLDLLVSL